MKANDEVVEGAECRLVAEERVVRSIDWLSVLERMISLTKLRSCASTMLEGCCSCPVLLVAETSPPQLGGTDLCRAGWANQKISCSPDTALYAVGTTHSTLY